MLWIAALVILLTLFYIWYEREYQRCNRSLENIPGPPPAPFVGNVLQIGDTTDILPKTSFFRKTYGEIFKVRFGPIAPMVILCETKSFEFILSSTNFIAKAWQYKYFHKWLGTGLLTSKGSKWRAHRKIITQAFHFKILEDFIGIFDSASHILMEKLRKEVGNDTFDLYPYISLCTLDIICESAMGTKVNAQEDSDSEYVRSVREMSRIVVERTYSIKMFDLYYYFTKDYNLEKRCLKVLHNFSNSVIKKKREQISNDSRDTSGDAGIKRRLAFLDLLIHESNAANYHFSDDDLREEVDTFMFEGHDTTSIAISMLLYSLSENPDVQKKVVDELNHIFGDDKNRKVTHQDLQEMKYLELVIKETLRLYPSVPGFGRELPEDTEMNGHVIPKGTTIGIFAYGIHREPEIFPEPERFIPERFEATSKPIPPFAYIPFSAGPRNCIGQKFATLEMKLVVSKVLREFEILPAVPRYTPILAAESVLKSANGVHVRLRERDVFRL